MFLPKAKGLSIQFQFTFWYSILIDKINDNNEPNLAFDFEKTSFYHIKISNIEHSDLCKQAQKTQKWKKINPKNFKNFEKKQV